MNRLQLIGGILGIVLLGAFSSAAFADRGYRDHDDYRPYRHSYVVRDYDHHPRWEHRYHHRRGPDHRWRDHHWRDRDYWYRPALPPAVWTPGRLGVGIFYVD
jgi:hypothetical protein